MKPSALNSPLETSSKAKASVSLTTSPLHEPRRTKGPPMNRIRTIVCFFLIAFSMTHVLPALAQTRVAYVDIQRAILETDEGKQAKARLKKEFDKRQKELDRLQADLKARKEELDKQAMTMDPAKRQAKEAELQQKLLELQQRFVQLQGELSQQEKQLTERILGRMEGVLREIAVANDFDMVLEKGATVLYAKESLDLTGELIRKYNRRYGKKAPKNGKQKGQSSP
ncbi:MAG: OmpH family outer membrane protein [Deltaproteobacteria bacterium]|nr:MAG: OmpH family outer membrane protein [Deltaproteobacteria bacterium]